MDITFNTRQQFDAIHTYEREARGGAMCSCGGFECPGLYGGACGYGDPDASECPCGCGNLVNEAEGVSYAYDREAFNWGLEGAPACRASVLPPDGMNVVLFRGQERLAETGVAAYSFELIGHGRSDHRIEAVLFYNGTEVDRIDGEDDVVGEVLGELHGMMQRHAGSQGG